MPAVLLEHLASARRIADHAERLGVQCSPIASRAASDHLGAVLADAILQSGISYRAVVRKRVERIVSNFPEAATMSGLRPVIDRGEAADFLLWNHSTKVTRFISLTCFLAFRGMETTAELRGWLYHSGAREHLLGLHGIGPKTFDYLCCLVGIDCIAVDRHVKLFVKEAGVATSDYDGLKSVVSYAADLLGLARRDFDAWIWRTISDRALSCSQLSLI